jgi:O-antigen ligase
VGGGNTFLHYPITGVGYGNYGFYHQFYAPHSTILSQSTSFPLTNSLVTRLLSETGLVGMSSLVLFVFYVWRRVYWINRIASRRDRTMTLTLWGGLVSAVVALTVGTPDLTFMYFWLLVAMVVVQIRLVKESLANDGCEVWRFVS